MSPWDPTRPYDELPLLPPPGELETKAVLKRCIDASRALAEVGQAAGRLPSPEILIRTMPLLEAQASSAIENIVTTTDALFREVASDVAGDPATKEARRYAQALLEAFGDLERRPITTGLAERICTRLRGIDMTVRSVPGTTLRNAQTGEVVYTPPSGEGHLRQLVANWERFVNEEQEPDPLVRLAVAHYQFEAIHPFIDGNGRTGRILNSLFLVQAGLLPLPIVYLSRYIIAHRDEYYCSLRAVTSDDAWEPWILYVLDGIAQTSRWTLARVEAIELLMGQTAAELREAAPKLYSHELVQLLFERPYCRIGDVTERCEVVRQTASKWLRELATIGILREEVHGREKLFVFPRYLKLLTSDDL
ncbi:Fic family protein [Engelhardtia mirabilis]|uniref:Adenosine monophosphate-protein transferase SoFic n=1 Tax=Engelhardtia mirabilis TaxID=2528011 RepID=A0A518BRP3_9BACT|nr:Adenosine monophosphate-protein transferase SoFic [Planctomycetes bacterium Pla133]QDV03973.1 Adenosine monophosphate-protein transferase SoFic [Planctomycetes bacterium Pla86]